MSVEQSKLRKRNFMNAVRRYRKNNGLPYTGAFNSWPKNAGEMEFRKKYNAKQRELERTLVINLLAEFGYDGLVCELPCGLKTRRLLGQTHVFLHMHRKFFLIQRESPWGTKCLVIAHKTPEGVLCAS